MFIVSFSQLSMIEKFPQTNRIIELIAFSAALPSDFVFTYVTMIDDSKFPCEQHVFKETCCWPTFRWKFQVTRECRMIAINYKLPVKEWGLLNINGLCGWHSFTIHCSNIRRMELKTRCFGDRQNADFLANLTWNCWSPIWFDFACSLERQLADSGPLFTFY